jgi:hypothetical protein
LLRYDHILGLSGVGRHPLSPTEQIFLAGSVWPLVWETSLPFPQGPHDPRSRCAFKATTPGQFQWRVPGDCVSIGQLGLPRAFLSRWVESLLNISHIMKSRQHLSTHNQETEVRHTLIGTPLRIASQRSASPGVCRHRCAAFGRVPAPQRSVWACAGIAAHRWGVSARRCVTQRHGNTVTL